MECITRGFCEINTTSIASDSLNSLHKDFKTLTDNYAEEHNKNIERIFGKDDLVANYLESVTLQNSSLALLRKHRTLLRKDHGSLVDSVKILSGGAAIADPLYSGSIGTGMLTGAVFGDLHKSPPSLTIQEVIRVISHRNRQGVLVIVSNNLANRLNFGSACQSAAQDGIKTLLINVGEDVSGVSVSKTIGRKGLCGIKFLFKIAGAMAEEKKTIYEIYQVIEKLKGNCLGSINVQIRPDMMVIGPGCKGEPEKLFFLWNTFDDIGENARVSFIVRQALSHLFHPSSYFSLHVVKGDSIALMINNLGNLSDFYLSLIIKETLEQIRALGIKILRIYCGRFLNANLAGFTISVLKVKDNIPVLELLDRPVNVTAWTEKTSVISAKPNILDLPSTPFTADLTKVKKNIGPKFTRQEAAYILEVLPNVIETVENMEDYLNKLDNDHDFGSAMTKYAHAIKKEIQNRSLKISSPYEFLDQMAYLAGYSMGGVAGGIFSILFSSAAQVFLGVPPMSSVDMDRWVQAARAARDGLMRYTRVQPGDGTILDALQPFVEADTKNNVKVLSKRVSAAVKGAEGTRNSLSQTSKGRASLISQVSGEESMQDEGVTEGQPKVVTFRAPDPGALCLACVIRTIFTCLQIELAEAEAAAEAETRAAVEAMEAKRRGSLKPSVLAREESRDEPYLEARRSILDVDREESRHGTKLEGNASKHGTKLEGESRHGTRLEGDSRHVTKLEEESRHGTKLEVESRYGTKLEVESRYGTKLEMESRYGTKLEMESRYGTKLEVESKYDTKMDGESRHGTTMEGESRYGMKLEGESMHGTKLEGKESKHGTKLEGEESKHGTKLEGKESRMEPVFEEVESKHSHESNVQETTRDKNFKREDSTLEKHMEVGPESKTKSKLLENAQKQKEAKAEQVKQLQETFEEIANEIENEIPDDV